MDEHVLQLLAERHESIVTRLDGINDRLDVLNGRTRSAEQKIAVLHDRQRLLWGGLSAVGAAFIAWIVERFK